MSLSLQWNRKVWPWLWEPGSQARMGASLVVMDLPILQNPSEKTLTHWNQKIQTTPPQGCLSAARNSNWLERSNAPHSNTERRRFRVTHPYHPLYQQELELVSYRQNWGEDRVWFQGSEGRLHSLPRSWTDAGGVDPFVAVAAGRSQFRVADLLELAKQIEEWKSERGERTVKGKMS